MFIIQATGAYPELGVKAHQQVWTDALIVDLNTIMNYSQWPKVKIVESGSTRKTNKCENENNGSIVTIIRFQMG